MTDAPSNELGAPQKVFADTFSAFTAMDRASPAPVADAKGGRTAALREKLITYADILVGHARRNRKVWPGDNDYEDAARYMREAAEALLLLEGADYAALSAIQTPDEEPSHDR